MKASPKKLLPVIVFAIAVTSLFSVRPAQAFTVTLQQVGGNVVGTGSGVFDLAGLTPVGPGFGGVSLVWANNAILEIGDNGHGNLDTYTGFTGPTNYGSGGPFLANIASGDYISIEANNGDLFLPMGYVSNTALTDSMTFTGATFASLGLTPGTYVWSWGDGGANENFTLRIGGGSQAPDGGSTVALLGFALVGLGMLRRKLRF